VHEGNAGRLRTRPGLTRSEGQANNRQSISDRNAKEDLVINLSHSCLDLIRLRGRQHPSRYVQKDQTPQIQRRFFPSCRYASAASYWTKLLVLPGPSPGPRLLPALQQECRGQPPQAQAGPFEKSCSATAGALVVASEGAKATFTSSSPVGAPPGPCASAAGAEAPPMCQGNSTRWSVKCW